MLRARLSPSAGTDAPISPRYYAVPHYSRRDTIYRDAPISVIPQCLADSLSAETEAPISVDTVTTRAAIRSISLLTQLSDTIYRDAPISVDTAVSHYSRHAGACRRTGAHSDRAAAGSHAALALGSVLAGIGNRGPSVSRPRVGWGWRNLNRRTRAGSVAAASG